jgi:hypothetical protein
MGRPQDSSRHPPKPGDVLLLDRRASVQFVSGALLFRVIRVDERPTYDGWVWLVGYSLDEYGNAIERRELFVQRTGLRFAAPRPRKG